MKLTRKRIQVVAKIFFSILTELDIDSVPALKQLDLNEGREFPVALFPGDTIHIYRMHSSCLIDYVRKGTGIPIRITVDDIEDYSLLGLKCSTLLPGYERLDVPVDRFGNIFQGKAFPSENLTYPLSELEELTK